MADTIWKGVATVDPTIIGGVITSTPISGSTGSFTTLNASGASALAGNVLLGTSAASTLGFYGTTKIAQRALAAQLTSLVGTASSTAVDTLTKAALIEVMNTLTALGLWKGAA